MMKKGRKKEIKLIRIFLIILVVLAILAGVFLLIFYGVSPPTEAGRGGFLNTVSNMRNFIYTMFGAESFSATAVTVNNCGYLINTEYEIYELSGSITGTGSEPCLTVLANNLIIDLMGKTIDGNFATAISINGYNNITIRNGVITNGDFGVFIQNSQDNSLENLELNSNGYAGVYLIDSDFNILFNLILDGNGVWISPAIYFDNGADNNKMINSQILNSVMEDVFSTSSTNVFLNTTYTSVSPSSSLTRKWYYQAYVDDGTNPLSGISVFVESIPFPSETFSLTTNSSGLTEKIEVVDYINNSGVVSYYNNYTINIDAGSYAEEINFSERGNVFDSISLSVGAPIPITSCGEPVDQPNTEYILQNNIEDNSLTEPCINITVENVTFNCDGKYIRSDDNVTGVYSNQDNTVIKNCDITMDSSIGGYGIGLWDANDSYVYNNVLNNQNVGLYLYAISGVRAEDNTIGNNAFGIIISNSSFNNSLVSNDVNSNIYGIYLYDNSDNNNLINNNFWDCKSIEGGCLSLHNSDNNLISGGIINLSANHLIYLTGSDNNKFENIQLYDSPTNASVHVDGSSENNVFDGLIIYSPNSPKSGINSKSPNTTIKNCNITTGSTVESYGISLWGADNSYVFNNVLNDQEIGLYLYSTSNVIAEGNIALGNTYGITIYDSIDNRIIDSDFSGNTNYDVYVTTNSVNNTFINVSYALFREYVVTNSELIRKWYYQAYVDDRTTPLDGISVDGRSNPVPPAIFNLTTNSSGLTDKIEVIDYVKFLNRIPFNNYTIDVDTGGYVYEVNFSESHNVFDSISLSTGAPIPITSCGEVLDQPNSVYILQNNIEIASGNCLNVSADNVTIDLDGRQITRGGGPSAKGHGISNIGNHNNLTVKNGYIYGYELGIVNTGSYGNFTDLIINSDFTDGSVCSIVGLFLASGNNNFVENVDVSGHTCQGCPSPPYSVVAGILGLANSGNVLKDVTSNSNTADLVRAIDFSNSDNNLIIRAVAKSNVGLSETSDLFISGFNNFVIDSDFDEVTLIGLGLNNTLLNVDYDKENIISSIELIRKWYYQARLMEGSTSNPVKSGILNANSSQSPLGDFLLTVDSFGFTQQEEIIEYIIDLSGAKINYTPYLINATNGTLGMIKELNVTEWASSGLSYEVISLYPENEIYDCKVLGNPGMVYTLMKDLTSNGTCLNITADNIVVDGNGYKILGDGEGEDIGIFGNGSANITIKNFAEINNFSKAIYLEDADDSIIKNNTLVADLFFENGGDFRTDYGIYIKNSPFVLVDENIINYIVSGPYHLAYGVLIKVEMSNFGTGTNITNNQIWVESEQRHARGIIFTNDGMANSNIISNNFVDCQALIFGSGIAFTNNLASSLNKIEDNIINVNAGTAEGLSLSGEGAGPNSVSNLLKNLTIGSRASGSAVGISIKRSDGPLYSSTNVLDSIIFVFSTGSGGMNAKGLEISEVVLSNFSNLRIWPIAPGARSTSILASDRYYDNQFRDSILLGTNYSVYFGPGLNSLNNVFTHVSYASGEEYVAPGAVELIRKWYYQALLTTSGGPLDGADLIANSSQSPLGDFADVSGTDGRTPVREIIEYTNNGGTKVDYSLYSMNASDEDYEKLYELNVSENIGSDGKVYENILLNPKSEIYYCKNLTKPNTIYTLMDNLIMQTGRICLDVQANNITIDLKGHKINGLDIIDSTGINVDGYNDIKIKNGEISDFMRGIRFFNNNNNNITNVDTVSNLYQGIFLQSSSGNVISNIDSFYDGSSAIYLDAASLNNNLSNIIANHSASAFTAAIQALSSGNILKSLNIIEPEVFEGLYLGGDNNLVEDVMVDFNFPPGAGSSPGIVVNGNYNNLINIDVLSKQSSVKVGGSHNIFTNVDAQDSYNDSIYVSGTNNSFTNLGLSDCGVGGEHSCLFVDGASNFFTGLFINGDSGDDDVAIEISNSDNLFKDVVVNSVNIGSNDILISSGTNNSFLNADYNKNKERVFGESELIRKWYYQAFLTAGAEPVVGASLIAKSSQSPLGDFLLTSGGNGYTDVDEIIEYVNFGGTRTDYSLYSMNASNGTLEKLYNLDISESKNVDLKGAVNQTILLNPANEIYDCDKILNKPHNIYVMMKDLNTSGSCLIIQADDITIDMNQYNITSTDFDAGDVAIDNTASHNELTIKKGHIYDFGTGIFSNGNNGIFSDLIISATGNFGSSSTIEGIRLNGGSNYLENINIKNLKNLGGSSTTNGLHLNSDFTVVKNLVLENISSTYLTRGIYLDSSSFNVFENIFLDSVSSGSNVQVIFLVLISINNNFTNVTISDTSGPIAQDVFLFLASTNNIFLNVSYITEAVEVGSSLIRKWYYQANVRDEIAPVNGASVTVTSNTVPLETFSLTTNPLGNTNVIEVIDYINDSGTLTYYNNYTIDSVSGAYSESHEINFSESENVVPDNIMISREMVGWSKANYPEGAYEPENIGLIGTHLHEFSIDFEGLNASDGDELRCEIIVPSLGSLQVKGNVTSDKIEENYSVNHTITSEPVNKTNPWKITNCTLYDSDSDVLYTSGSLYDTTLNKSILVHENIWTRFETEDSDAFRALQCYFNIPNQYFRNLVKCDYEGDVAFADSMAKGFEVEGICDDEIDNDGKGGVDCADRYCEGILYSCNYAGQTAVATVKPSFWSTILQGLGFFSIGFGSAALPGNCNNGICSETLIIGGKPLTYYYTGYVRPDGSLKIWFKGGNYNTGYVIQYLINGLRGFSDYGIQVKPGAYSLNSLYDDTGNIIVKDSDGYTGEVDFVLIINISGYNDGDTGLFNLSITHYNQNLIEYNLPFEVHAAGPTNWDESWTGLDVVNPCYSNSNIDEDLDYKIGCSDENCDGQDGNSDGDKCEFGVETICNDDFDNDANGFRDCLNIDCDGQIGEPSGTARCEFGDESLNNCGDNFDNDADLRIDCYDQSTCWHQVIICPSTERTSDAACFDGKDNDYDNGTGSYDNNPSTGVDCLDSDCLLVSFGGETCSDNETINETGDVNLSRCFDGIDNDFDAATDGVDCSDSDCKGAENPDNPGQICMTAEFNVGAFNFDDWFENTGLSWISHVYCANGIDDDGDKLEPGGGIDCSDPDCNKNFRDCGPCPAVENITWDSCANVGDDDTDGPKDCSDDNCDKEQGDLRGSLCEIGGETICNDKFDNDDDGNADCRDGGCAGRVGEPGGTALCEDGIETICNDGFDNDDDGNIDCVDTGCYGNGCALKTWSTETFVPIPFTTSWTSVPGTGISVRHIYRNHVNDNYEIDVRGNGDYESITISIGEASVPSGYFLYDATACSLSGDTDKIEWSTNQEEMGQLQQVISFNDNFEVKLTCPGLSVPDSGSYLVSVANSFVGGASEQGDLNLNSRVYENILPSVNSVEPSSVEIPYNGGFKVRGIPSDDSNGISRCGFLLSKPGISRFDISTGDCIGFFNNIVEDGPYALRVNTTDNSSNTGNPNLGSINVNVLPIQEEVSINREQPFYNASAGEIIIYNANFRTADGELINSWSAQIIDATGGIVRGSPITNIGTNPAYINGQFSLSGLSDGIYYLIVRATDEDLDEVVSDKKVFYICSSYDSSGENNGQRWSCSRADFSQKGFPDQCVAGVSFNVDVGFSVDLLNASADPLRKISIKNSVSKIEAAYREFSSVAMQSFNVGAGTYDILFSVYGDSFKANITNVDLVTDKDYNLDFDKILVADGPIVYVVESNDFNNPRVEFELSYTDLDYTNKNDLRTEVCNSGTGTSCSSWTQVSSVFDFNANTTFIEFGRLGTYRIIESSAPPLCGNGQCDAGECDTCPDDCSSDDCGSDCFVSGTKVSTLRREVNVEEIKPGDEVISYDIENNKKSLGTVTEVYMFEREIYYLINNEIKVTDQHPFYINGEWVKVKDLEVGDLMFNGKDYVEIKSIRYVSEPVTVYNMLVNDYYNYFAENILVHNKGGGPGGPLPQPPGNDTKFELEPAIIQVELERGQKTYRNLTITSVVNYPVELTLSSIGLERFLLIRESNFFLGALEERDVVLEFFASEDEMTQVYTGNISAIGGGMTEISEVIVEVSEADSLLNVTATIPKEYKQRSFGQDIKVLINIDDKTIRVVPLDAVLSVYLTDMNKNILQELPAEMVTLGEDILIERIFQLSENLTEGNYLILVRLEYDGKILERSDDFDLEEREFPKSGIVKYLRASIIILLLALIILASLFLYKKILDMKKGKPLFSFKSKKPGEPKSTMQKIAKESYELPRVIKPMRPVQKVVKKTAKKKKGFLPDLDLIPKK